MFGLLTPNIRETHRRQGIIRNAKAAFPEVKGQRNPNG